ncbi:hypothetical protein GCM10010508_32290 [Streptomyces naganishii JCM 4654]|uniref:Uncharacterized protein n=1 Tax=Streptomyces naganishii JCM 4654 TaxID=1306179 RepID=A0A918Y446_9ACTN|nr:hypothetical protein GCM10010508_32290 [Streptomyces naganishii JCM 4654]
MRRGCIWHPGRAARSGVRYFCTVDKKNALRAGTLAAGTTLMMLLMSSPALALTRDDGDDPGPGLSVIQTLGIFVGIPLALFLIITGLVVALDKSRAKQRDTSRNVKVKAEA